MAYLNFTADSRLIDRQIVWTYCVFSGRTTNHTRKTMARTKVNKSAAIRDALKANPGKSPKEIAEIVSKGGVKVTAMYVSTIKTTMGKKKGKRGRKPGSQSSNGVVADLQNTIVYVKGVGGLDKAKELIALLESVRGV